MFTLCWIDDYTTCREWGDNYRLHVRGCAHLSRRNVDWKFDVDTVDEAVHAAFADHISEHVISEDGVTIQGVSFEEAKRYLHICACAKKVIV
tara:strand:- start:3754 stop:4029 length:276 start_codon:yes stop_codon:yes gene_type:complete